MISFVFTNSLHLIEPVVVGTRVLQSTVTDGDVVADYGFSKVPYGVVGGSNWGQGNQFSS